MRKVSKVKKGKFRHSNFKFLDYRKNNCKPTIIIDLYALIDIFQVDVDEILCGGRYNKLCEKYEKFMKNLQSMANLIFFEDGTLHNQKINTWIQRQNNKYNKAINVIRCLEKDALRNCNYIPRSTAHRTIIEETAKKYGKLIKSSLRDCDTEIASYAAKHSILAVIADDTDFLIFAGKWRYFSAKQINLSTRNLVTMEYNRKALRHFLRLSDDQLILLATFNGNDIIPYEDVREFHKALIGPGHDFCNVRFSRLANFIRSNSLEKMIRQISYHVNADCLKLFGESVDMYNTSYDEHENAENKLLSFCHAMDFFFVSEIFKSNIQTFTLSYSDLRQLHMQKLPHAYITLLRKQIGIVLMHERKGSETRLITKLSHGEDYKIYTLTPIYPDKVLPPFIELLDRVHYREHDKLRFELLAWTVSEQSKALQCIPPNYLLDILVLIFLRENELITLDEAYLILLTIDAVEKKVFANIPKILQLSPRATQVSFMFTKLHVFLQHSLEVTGLKGLTVINFH